MRPVIALALAVTACAPKYLDAPELAGPRPDNYRQIAAAYARAHYFDPYSLRDVSLSEPITGRMFDEQGWLVCLRANAKNRMGAYTGLRSTALLIRNGDVIDTDDEAGSVCSAQRFTTAPDIERGDVIAAPSAPPAQVPRAAPKNPQAPAAGVR